MVYAVATGSLEGTVIKARAPRRLVPLVVNRMWRRASRSVDWHVQTSGSAADDNVTGTVVSRTLCRVTCVCVCVCVCV